ncbi:MAG: methyltransferase, TrmH family, group 1 [Gammaproteobacteria bacterium]|jgi:TrmH family RNA methyltransferase|nr:methyltransferase, TrmH family, group 1 [Gammaproteobacteria bacterium]
MIDLSKLIGTIANLSKRRSKTQMKDQLLEKIRNNIDIVLVNTSHPGNIGAAARAMKTMNLQQLVLVAPVFYPHADATARAAGADDILYNCKVVNALSEAVADCQWVIGTSARHRHLPWPQLSPRECGEKTVSEAIQGRRIALVFGREKTGLSNEELQLCHYHVQIPSNPDYSSLNLASAVQVLAYEINMTLHAMQSTEKPVIKTHLPATGEEMASFYEHLERVLLKLEVLDPKQPRQLLRRLHRLFNRAQLEREEIHILRGVLTAVERHLRR